MYDSRIAQNILNGGVGGLGPVFLGEGFSPALVTAVYGHQLCALGLVDTRSASGVSKVAGADDCPPD